MTTSYLPDDCIYCILKYLQPCRLSLFNCLLVNRFWCKATVPLLYADPFHFGAITKRHSTIILTLILCFNKTDILQIKNQLKLINIDNININDEYKPLFKYPQYLENYRYYKINFLILLWIKLHNQRYYYDYGTKIKAIFHQSILHQRNNNIKQLEIPTSFNNELQTFAKLNSLILLHDSNKVSSEFLNNLANICFNLRKLEIQFSHGLLTYSKEKIYTFIQKQNNLKALVLMSGKTSRVPLPNDIFLPLEFQKNSLVYIEFENFNFSNISFENFINLCNLKYLKFDNCKGISLEQCEILKFASFKLKVLMTRHNQWNDNIKPLMIKYLGASLKKLVSIESLTVPMIENISIYCLNLITLELVFYSSHSLIIPYFKNLKIKTLTLFNYNRLIENSINLANNLLTSVKEVSIWYLNDPQHFKVFLENCHNCLETIRLHNHLSHTITKHVKLIDLLKIILNTERSNKFLKFYIMENRKYEIGEELKLLELLDQIKAKGIKATVVPFKIHPDFKHYIYE